ncbi:ABC-2 family transporter protein [bacterium]|nr:ABC-2 family transporter protein [bacterium]
MNIPRLISVFIRVGVMSELAYRANFLVQLLESVLDLATAFAGIAVIFSYTKDLSGWRPDEVIALVGVFFMVGGAIRFMIQPSLQEFIRSVRRGTLDFTLTKPADSQLLISIQRVEIWKLTDIVLGVIVFSVALTRMGTRLDLLQVAGFAAALVTGGSIVYCFWVLLASLSFWFVRVENILVIFQSMYEAGRWPISIYPRWLRFALTFIVPVAVATTVPAQALTGRLTWQALISAAAVAALLFAVTRVVWRIGTRRYSGASA